MLRKELSEPRETLNVLTYSVDSYVNKETKTDGPAKDTRANTTQNVRPLVTTERRLDESEMANSEPNAAMSISDNTGENERQVTHVVDEAMVAAIEGIVNKLVLDRRIRIMP